MFKVHSGVKGNGNLGFWARQLVLGEVSCHVEDGSWARGWGRDTGAGSDPGYQASSSRLGDCKASWEASVQAWWSVGRTWANWV